MTTDHGLNLTDFQQSAHNDNAALLMLIAEMSKGMQALRESGSKQTEDTHATRLAIAKIEAGLTPLSSIPSKVAVIETRCELHQTRLDALDKVVLFNSEAIRVLAGDENRRKGLEGPVGKIAIAAIAALVAALVGAILFAIGIRPQHAPRAETSPAPTSYYVANKPRTYL